MSFLFIVVAVLSAWGLTWLLRRYALARSIIDVPNARSSHCVPTPRGGGVAIVVSFLVALVWMRSSGLVDAVTTWSVFGAGVAIAILGFLDDHGHIAARWRLLGHFGASAWALWWLGGLPPLTLFGSELQMGWIGHSLALFYLVWLLNLYNFMDGIDGLASVEAITTCISVCLLYILVEAPDLVSLPLILAATVAGFLFWNFPPARIFMGDAGSGFLGITLGILSLQAAWVSSDLLCAWLILLGVFIVDATVTLLRRLLRGDKVYEAHRSHGYQYASRRFGRHLPVTLAVLLINLIWLLPMAALVALNYIDAAVGVIIAWSPLVVLAFLFNAGELEKV
ncbi:MraY family glycosyltransferase [Pseudomonas sp. NUPR-001]|uniref:MraY family glycosyltransferase n=1 Tax=Pseudomonas sp. NUPR-001 TaxID=3416058 RepID=UPI003F9B9869